MRRDLRRQGRIEGTARRMVRIILEAAADSTAVSRLMGIIVRKLVLPMLLPHAFSLPAFAIPVQIEWFAFRLDSDLARFQK